MTVCAVPTLRSASRMLGATNRRPPLWWPVTSTWTLPRVLPPALSRRQLFTEHFQTSMCERHLRDHCSIEARSSIGSSREDLLKLQASRSTLRFPLRTITHSLSRCILYKSTQVHRVYRRRV